MKSAKKRVSWVHRTGGAAQRCRGPVAPLAAVVVAISGCTRSAPPDPAEHAADTPAPTNRVAVPAAVRENLGITFARVERRAVASTIRVPGRFELLPSARREYHAPLAGRVEVLVEQYQPVEAGDVLYRLESPAWRELQREIAAAEGELRRAVATRDSIGPLLEAHARHERTLEEAVSLWEQRVAQLEELRAATGSPGGGDLAEARAALGQARSDLAEIVEQDAELEARRLQAAAEADTAGSALELLLAGAATVVGESVEWVTQGDAQGRPRWRTLTAIDVKAGVGGVVESIAVTTGSWVDERSDVLATVRPELVRFRARGLQSDLGRLRDGLAARVAPPAGGSIDPAAAMEGTLEVGLAADADERTVDLLMTPGTPAAWARAGVSGFLEVVTDGGRVDLAIPLSSVVRDGLTPVVFRRDPRNPDQVIRMEADLGIDDGRWVAVKSGVREGDEVVLEGVYQLMLATSGTAARGGHFHSDGTFHEGED